MQVIFQWVQSSFSKERLMIPTIEFQMNQSSTVVL